jgi:DNA polymerase-3 subunit beta
VKFRCERDVLVDALSTAGRAVASRGGSLPVLSGIRMVLAGDDLVLTGSDLELTITARVEVTGQVDGEAVLPARLVTDAVKALEPGRVELAVDNDEAALAGGRTQYALRTIPPAEYPRITEPAGEGVSVPADLLREALRQVVAAASHDESRPILTGVKMEAEAESLRLVATDSYRLAVRDLRGASFLPEGQQVIVPSGALRELARLLDKGEDVEVRLGEREAAFALGRCTLVTRLIEGEFPNYRNLIPEKQPNILTVSREGLQDAVRRVRVVANEPANPIRLSMTADGLELSANAQDIGNAFEQLDAKYEGTDLVVAFNPEYLMSGIEASTGDEITIETVNELKPALLRSQDSADFLYLLMPVRVS